MVPRGVLSTTFGCIASKAEPVDRLPDDCSDPAEWFLTARRTPLRQSHLPVSMLSASGMLATPPLTGLRSG